MDYEQYTRTKGETYVEEPDFSTDGIYRPVVIRGNGGNRRRGGGGNSGSYRSYDWYRRDQPRFLGYRGYVPQWARYLWESVWDRIKLDVITAIVSPIVFAKLPQVLEFLFHP